MLNIIFTQLPFAIEKGSSTDAFGAYAQVLFVLGLEKDLLKLVAMTFWEENFRMRRYL